MANFLVCFISLITLVQFLRTDLHKLSFQKTWWSLQKRMNLISSSLRLQKQQRGKSSLMLNKPLTSARQTEFNQHSEALLWRRQTRSLVSCEIMPVIQPPQDVFVQQHRAAALHFSSDWKHYVAYRQDEVVEHRSSLQLRFPQEMFISDKRNQACDNYAAAQPKPPGENSSASNIRWHFFASNPFFLPFFFPRCSRSLNKEIKLL